VSKPSLRVYLVPRGSGEERTVTGTLLRTFNCFWDSPVPSAFGATEGEVLADLERQLLRRVAGGEEPLSRYLWTESFVVREARIDVHPLSSVKKRPVIGKKNVPLRLSYAASKLEGGGHRIMLPRFGGWFIVEDLSLAAHVLEIAVSGWLLGEDPKTLYDFRWEGEEYVREWTPPLVDRPPPVELDSDFVDMPALSAVSDSLVTRAARGKLAPAVGEAPELHRLVQLASRQPPASVLLVGPPGVGKTTLVRRLARHFASKKKGIDRQPRIFATSADRILSGMVYLGMWQQRCLDLVAELEGEGDYLYVDRLTGILAPQPDGASVAEMLEPSLAAEQLSLLAECTPSELERARRTNASFVASFEIVRVEEPSPTATADLLRAYAEKKRKVKLHPLGARRTVELLAAFQRGTAFPGKAIRFLDWLAQDADERRARRGEAGVEPSLELLPRDVTEAFSRHSGIPVELLSDETAASTDSFAERLSTRVVGQKDACLAASRVLSRLKAGMNDPDRPIGSLLLVGPTGVGKTHLARAIARTVFGDESRLIRLDMSEYGAWGSAPRLIEARPGARSLARRVAEQPLSVVLLDEIEKAHPEVFDVLLGVLGEGRLTDSTGRFVDFRGTLVLMTSNLGVRDGAPLGFGEGAAPDFSRAVRAHFRPELFNRIDAVVPFRSLSEADVRRIVDLELEDIRERRGLVRRAILLRATDAARSVLAERGHHPTYGARPLRRLLEERVVSPIAARLAASPDLRDCEIVLVREGEEPKRAPSAIVIDVGL
jgi:ATP-dependent Clp protease ATP-binding subunit ClpC